jgi:hypothetical protein
MAQSMSGAQIHAEKLRQSRHCNESTRRQDMEGEIARMQRHAHSAQRAVCLMAFVMALAVAGLGYPTILLENFPQNAPAFFVNLMYALGVGSLISLVAFASLGLLYRKKASRCLAARLFATPIIKPAASSPPLRPTESHFGHGENTP